MTAPHGNGSLAEPEQQETPGATPRGGTTKARLAIAAAVIVAIVAVVLVTVFTHSPSLGHAGSATPADKAAPALSNVPQITPIAPLAVSTPLRVSAPTIGANSSLVPVGVDAQNHMQVPPVSQPMQAAWYNRAPTPGAVGPSVVVGHVNGDGKQGIFANLSKMKAGDQVSIDRADHQTAVFTIYNVTTVPKDKFPTEQVYGNTSDAQLRLITCGGELDRAAHNYLSNVVVYGVLTGVHPT